MGTLLVYTVYSDDKTIKAGIDLAQQQLLIYKLLGEEYELYQTVKQDIGIPSNLTISGNGKVLMVTRNNNRAIGIVYVYKQMGSTYLLINSIISDDPQPEDEFGNNIVLDYEGNVISIS
jgi:hypothetical protein